ncbi:hypothetical protein LUZ60_001721 [Juncus effusus]|nr:hypothetical protein LUZ60_001721 [Juncus effusus]
MGSEIRESLRRLCVEIGWSFAVFWKAIHGINQMQLVWGEGHCEKTSISGFEAMDLLLKEKVAHRNPCQAAELAPSRADDRLNTLVYKLMVHQVHILGQGIIGHAALTNVHLWILQDNIGDYASISKALSEMKQQFWAGVQTIAVIPVHPHGVIQLGSTNMVMEDINFINHIRCMFISQLGFNTFLEDSRRFFPQNNISPLNNLNNYDLLNPALNPDPFFNNTLNNNPNNSNELFKPKSVNQKFREMSIHENNNNHNIKQEEERTGNDLFDILGINKHKSTELLSRDATSASLTLTDSGMGPTISDSIEENNNNNNNNDDNINNILSFSGLLCGETDPDQLLDAIVSNLSTRGKGVMVNNPSIGGSGFNGGSSSYEPLPESSSVKTEISPNCINNNNNNNNYSGNNSCENNNLNDYKSQISMWVENNNNNSSGNNSIMEGSESKRSDETGRTGRKRSRVSGENPRPRPKDRQLIQDRIKELREIVPNGEKCSIDALLEKTIKHMMFLQSVAKHADKLKEAGEPKINSKEGGLLLKDNYEGGATWAFEIGTQSMSCPIIVEDLNSPRQMLVEMLCKERGVFLEIADEIRGLGLTILKGVMEVRKDKVWARFAVEANKEVTRMEIFLALVHLLEPNSNSSLVPTAADNNLNLNNNNNAFYHSSIPATGLL